MSSDTDLEKLVNSLEIRSTEIREHIIRMTNSAGSGHPGGSLSSADIIIALYFYKMKYDPYHENSDKFVLSKAHAAPALYATLAEAGFVPKKKLSTLRKIGSKFQGHPSAVNLGPLVLVSTGSLGQGASIANGMGLAGKLDGLSYRVFFEVGDGEVEEGQIWEAAMTAAHYKLDNVCGIMDRNHLQIDGKVSNVMDIRPVAEKFQSFGWHTININGNNFYDLIGALDEAENVKEKPTMIIAHTTKGKGVSFMENELSWHGTAPDDIKTKIALLELEARKNSQRLKEHTKLEVGKPSGIKKKLLKKNDAWYELPKFGGIEKTRVAYGKTLAVLGDIDNDIVALDGDLACSTQSAIFGEKFPERFFNMGIAEADMIGTAAGLAACGKKPYASSFAVFATGRAYDQIRMSVAYSNLNVKIVGSHGGVITGEDGASHIMLEDIALMRVLPNMTVVNPCDAVEMARTIEASRLHQGPMYIRMYREGLPVLHDYNDKFEIGKGEKIMSGSDLTLVATGDMVFRTKNAAKRLKKEGIDADVINMSTIKPIDDKLIRSSAYISRAVLTIEDHFICGGLGDAVSDVINELNKKRHTIIDKMGIEDRFVESGKPEGLIKKYGISEDHIFNRALKLYDTKKSLQGLYANS